jgi:hypothetical protein
VTLTGRLVGAAGDALEQVDLRGAPVEDAAERRAVAQRPDDGRQVAGRGRFSSSSSRAIGLRVGRSHLFMNVKMGTPRRRQTSKSLRVCVSMPLAASITMSAASTAVSTR